MRAESREQDLLTSFKCFSEAAAIVVFILGCMGMAGWLFDVPVLKSVVPGLATMEANTALGLCLSGASLWLWKQKPDWAMQRLAQVSGFAVALLGTLTLGEYVVGREFGINDLLFRANAAQSPHTVRMSPLSALNFLLVGLALGWLRAETRSGRRPAQFLALLAAGVAATALTGYLYSVAILYRPVSYTEMALHTALAFVVLSGGILCALPERGLMALWLDQGGGGRLVRRLLPVSLLSVLTLDWLMTAVARRGLYEPKLVAPLSTMASLSIIAFLIWRHAKAQQGAEREQRESEARYRSLAELSPDGILINFDNRIGYVNPTLVKLLGAEGPEQILCKSPFEIIHVDDHALVRARMQRVLSGEVMPPIEERFLKLDGNVIPVEVTAAPYPDRSGRGIQVIVRDIHERKRLEDQLRAQNERLCEADRHKDEFLAMLAHELRNPLAPLLIAAQLLEQRGAEDPALAQWAGGVIKHQGEQLSHLVNELLDVARVTQGKITLRKIPLDLREVIDRAVETHRPLIDEHRHALTLSLSSEPMQVAADPVRLEQMIGNLLNNAAKYTPDGGRIDLSLVREGEAAMVRVRDNGFGISATMLPKVFGLFTQAERTPDRAQGGLGIGLALVKSLVEMHGGSVEAHSEGLGRGSEFVLRLPLLSQDLRLADAPEHAATRRNAAPVRRVLVVDDNTDVATSIALLLKTMGHEVQVAISGREALNVVKTAPLDVVLLDIGMPDLNGYEVARRLRQEPGLGPLKLIAMSGYGQDCDWQKSEAAGFDHHLVKPVDLQELEQILTT